MSEPELGEGSADEQEDPTNKGVVLLKKHDSQLKRYYEAYQLQ